MGCDIHLYVEKYVPATGWVAVDKFKKEDGSYDVDYHDRFYHDRNYNLFSILADVRNGAGFAGCDTGNGFRPIAPPRGLPKDVSSEVARASEGWGADGHSHSYHTVADLMAYDWTQTTKLRGYVNGPQLADWMRWGKGAGLGPKNYCGDVGGGGIQKIDVGGLTLKVLAAKDDEAKLAALSKFYCQVQWETPYWRPAQYFLGEVLPRLWRLGTPGHVRIVFWFDN